MERDVRYHKMDMLIRGDFSVYDPDGEKVESRSPNMIQVALEDTSEAASQMPTVRVIPRRNQPRSKKQADTMEYIAAGYMESCKMDMMIPQAIMDMAAFGLHAWVVWPDYKERLPIIERRDPRTCYPEPGLRAGQEAKRVIFTQEVRLTQLPQEWRDTLLNAVRIAPQLPEKYRGKLMDYFAEERQKINLVEYFDADECVIGGVVTVNPSQPGYGFGPLGDDPVEIPVVLERIPNQLGVCQVVIGRRLSHDSEYKGQFDQVVGVLEAHIRLQGLLLDYSDQAVYSDVWVKDLIGEMSWGGGGYIELGPQGAIGRVPPAVSSLNVQQDLERLVENFHLGSRWPKSRPGEIDQAIASAKFLEATAGMMNTAIKTYHQIMGHSIEAALRMSFLTDLKYFPGQKMASGILRNQEFVEQYEPSHDIDIMHRIKAEYGLGLGRDPAQSAVLMIQYAKEGYISNEFVQENIEGLNDVTRERQRIDAEALLNMAKAMLLQGLQQGEIDHAALPNIYDARLKGEEMMDLYRKYVVTPKQQAAAGPQSAVAGPGGAPPGPIGSPPPGLPPGGPPGPPGAGPGGPGVPPPPQAAQLLQRLQVPAGQTGSLGVMGR